VTNRIALILAALIVALVALDLLLGLGGTLFLARKFFALLDWLAFWR
jgi:hypothetical protein